MPQQGQQQASSRVAGLVELAWSWLHLQPDSALTQWFCRPFAGGGKRMRRMGIVALARKLAIALWRDLEYGEIPSGGLAQASRCLKSRAALIQPPERMKFELALWVKFGNGIFMVRGAAALDAAKTLDAPFAPRKPWAAPKLLWHCGATG